MPLFPDEHKSGIEELLNKKVEPQSSRVLPQKREWKEGETDARGGSYKAIPGKRHFHLWELKKIAGTTAEFRCLGCPDAVTLVDVGQ